MKNRILTLLIPVVFITLSCFSETARSEGDALASGKGLFKKKGFTYELTYTGEFAAITKGGIKTGTTYLGNLDLQLTVDTGVVGWWKDGKFFVYILNNHGGKPTGQYIGDLQTASNIEATQTTRLYEFWYEHTLLEGALSFLIGQHDLNSEFDITEYGGLFINSSFGIQPDISANTPVSIFPVAAPGIRIKWKPSDEFYLMAGIYDGDPGSPAANNTGMKVRIAADEGVMTIWEAGWVKEQTGDLHDSFKVGFWYHSDSFDDVSDVDSTGDPVKHRGNSGVYFVADSVLYKDGENHGVGIFFQAGLAPDDRNEVDLYAGVGINAYGLVPWRSDDNIGFAIAHASISDKLVSNDDRNSSETTLEATYRARVNTYLTIQPDLQFIINPGADPSIRNATVGLLRFELTLL